MNNDVVFSLRYRWTLKLESLSHEFVKSVSFDYLNKIITLQYYDFCSEKTGFDAILWADKVINNKFSSETLIFTAYDSKGSPLYEFKFLDLTIVGCNSPVFHYGKNSDENDNDFSYTTLVIKYENIEKRLMCCSDKFNDNVGD